MKKNWIACLFALLALSVFAQEKTSLDFLIEEDVLENYNEIRLLSTELTTAEQILLYEKHKMHGGRDAALNILPFAFGSMSQGDQKGQIIASAGQVLGASLFISGQLIYARDPEDTSTALLLVGTGAPIYFGSTLYSIFRAYLEGWRFNNVLKDAIGI
jgi:hypothetical protein